MGPTQLVAQNHGKKACAFGMEEKGFALFHGSEIPPEHIGETQTLVSATQCKCFEQSLGFEIYILHQTG